jgi:hypothetical protein
MAVVKINVYKEEVGYDDRRSTVIISAKVKRKAFAEKLMFKHHLSPPARQPPQQTG